METRIALESKFILKLSQATDHKNLSTSKFYGIMAFTPKTIALVTKPLKIT